MDKGRIGAHLARAILAEALGVAPRRLRWMRYGHSSTVYEVILPDRRQVILRLNKNPRVFAGTAHTIATLGNLGLPVPTVLASDLTMQRFPVAYVLLERLPGRDLYFALPGMSRVQLSRLAEQLIAIQRKVATLPEGTGYGWVSVGTSGPFPSWTAVIERDTRKGLQAVEDLLDQQTIVNIRSAIEQFQAHYAEVPPTCFLDDITSKNVLIHRGRLAGIVDLDVVCYGDVLYWLALTQTALLDRGEKGAFYLDELCRLWPVDALERRIVDAYTVIFILDFLASARRDGDLEDVPWLFEALERFTRRALGDPR